MAANVDKYVVTVLEAYHFSLFPFNNNLYCLHPVIEHIPNRRLAACIYPRNIYSV